MPTPYVVVGDIMLLKLTDVLYPHQISHSGEKACLLSCLRATRGQGANTRAYALVLRVVDGVNGFQKCNSGMKNVIMVLMM